VIDVIGIAALAACLVGVSSLATRVWGHGVGGIVSAFPLIVGPVLFLAARRQDAAFAADTAAATLLGLVALSGFVVVYGRAAGRFTWPLSVALGWTAAAVSGLSAGLIGVGFVGAHGADRAADHRPHPRRRSVRADRGGDSRGLADARVRAGRLHARAPRA
jgi:hypothetical protein